MAYYYWTVNGLETFLTMGDDVFGGMLFAPDWIHGAGGNDVIHGFGGNDTLFGDMDSDMLYGGPGDDWLEGGDGCEVDYLDGGADNDSLNGGPGADILNGGPGNDTVFYSGSLYPDGNSTCGVAVNLTEGEGYWGSAEGDVLFDIENIVGSAFNDVLTGNTEQNVLFGSNGNDTLHGGAGADTLSGGDGMDTASYSDSSVGVTVVLFGGLTNYGDAEGDVLSSIESLTGSNHADVLGGDFDVNVLTGLNGNDTLKGFGGADTLEGGHGNDTLHGGAGADTLNGFLGSDTASYENSSEGVGISLEAGLAQGGEAEGDTLLSIENVTGSAYRDQLWGDEDANVLRGMNGNDTLKGAGGMDTLWGGTGHDELFGHDDPDTLRGEAGNDILDGGVGADTMSGGLDSDTYYVDNPNDSVTESGGQGLDTVYASATWTLTSNADVETLRTTNDAGTAAINLSGNSTGNTVRGNAGSNVINGGGGNDFLTGLGGQDAFLFNTVLNAATNVDHITDFNVVNDTIRLDDTVFSAFANGPLAAERFVVGAAAQDASDNIIYNNVTGALFYDSDGVGAAAAIQFATVTPGTALTHLDFLVV